MKIRKMKAKDVKDAYQLWKKAGLNVASYKREKLEVKNTLRLNPSTCFVLEERNNLVGTILGAFNGRRVWIYHLAIHPGYQRKGMGTLLLKKLEEKLEKKKATKILLGIDLNNLTKVNFYQKHDYYVMNDAVIMAKDLYPHE